MQNSFLPTIIDIFLFITCLEMVFYLVERVINARFAKEKSEIVKKAYPNLSEKDLKFRSITLSNYSRIHLNSSFKNRSTIILGILLFASMVGIIMCVFSDNYSGICFGIAGMFFLASLIALSGPNFQKQQIFWQNYLNEHPDNPLMVVLTPIEPKYSKLIKFWKFNAFFRIFCAFYALYVGYILFQLNL